MAAFIRSIFKNRIFWYLFSRYFSLALQFFASIFLAVKLDVYYFGIWSFMLLLINIGSCFNWGIGNATTILLVQHKDDQILCRKYIFNAILLVCISFVLPLAVLIYDRISGIDIFSKYHLENLIYVVTAVIILQYLCNFFVNIFRVRNRIIEIIIQQSLWPLIMFCLIFTASGKTLLDLLAWGYVITLSLVAGFLIALSRSDCRSSVSTVIAYQIISKGFFLFIYNACFLAIMLSTKLLISYFYSVTEFGYFSFAFSLAQGVILLIDSLIFLIFPKMIDMLKGNDAAQIKSSIKILRDNYLLPLHLIFYMILMMSFPFFHFIPQYSKSLLPFGLILFTLVMYSNCFGYNSYLLAQNREKSFSLIVFIALLANVLLVWLLGGVLGIRFEYVVFGTLLVYFLYSIAVNCYALYCLGERNLVTYLRENLVSKSIVIYFSTLILVITIGCHWWIFAGIFIVFILFHIPQLNCLKKNVIKLIHNDKLINV